MKNYDEPFITKEQKKDFDFLKFLSSEMTNQINNKKVDVLESLTNKTLDFSKLKTLLNTFVHERIYFDDQEIEIEGKLYKYCYLTKLATKLYNDKSFFGNDSPYVINALSFYENSITFEDIIIAFHNYCLSRENETLWYLSRLLCRYVYSVLSMDNKYKEVSFESDKTYDELKNLAKYVVDFYNQFLSNVKETNFTLSDDRKPNYYDRIDFDADYYFAIKDAENDEKIIQLKAKKASDLIKQCSKSLYLLLSTLREINDTSFSSEIKDLRSTIVNICQNIYSLELDAYNDLENDTLLNNSYKDYEIKLLKLTLNNALDKLKKYDSTTVLMRRQEVLQMNRLMSNTEDFIDYFNCHFSNLLEDTIDINLYSYQKRIESELGSKFNLLPKTALNTLASAEFLYDKFVRKTAPDEFDYSGIAVLYFQAFETTYNILLIQPYSNWLEKKKVDNLFKDLSLKKKQKKIQNLSKEELERFEKTKELKLYFSSKFSKQFYFKNNSPVIHLEIGKFEKFIDLYDDLNQNKESTANQLIYFLENQCFKKKIDSSSIKQFANAVRNATEPRNFAAHGSHELKINDVEKDKVIVYDDTDVKDVQNFKNLLYEFLNFFA